MEYTPLIITLAPLLLESTERGLQELERTNLDEVLKEAIRSAFSEQSGSAAIEKLLSNSSPSIRAAGGTIKWVQQSRNARFSR